MKWSKTLVDHLPKKKTLNREDLNKDSDSSIKVSPRREGVQETSCCDTWPKMRKKKTKKFNACDSSDGEDQRPTTANLEAPVVLDPELIDKLDMSIIDKESLSISLTRINLGQGNKCANSLERKKRNGEHSATNRVSFGSQQSLIDTDINLKTAKTENSSITASPSEGKRLDNNNNKNKRGASSQLRSPIHNHTKQDSTLILKEDSRTSSKKYETFSRQSNRSLHSHPMVSTSSSTVPRSSTTNLPVRSARPESARKPLLRNKSPTIATPRSVNLQNIYSREKILSSDLTGIRKTKSATPSKVDDCKMLTGLGKRRPMSVTCYICGREFGSASFPIHEPKCLEKWNRENNLLPIAHRRSTPQRPNVPIDHEDWNTAAWDQSQALLIPCLKCKRTFLPDRLVVHEKNCRVQNKGHRNISQSLIDCKELPLKSLMSPRTSESEPMTAAIKKNRRIPVLMSLRRKNITREIHQILANIPTSRKSSRIAIRKKNHHHQRHNFF